MMGIIKDKIKKQARELRLALIIGLAIIVAALIIIKPNFGNGQSFEIEDKCGKFVNLVSHTIGEEPTCRSRCRAQCLSMDYKYDKVEFGKSDTGCNSCKCFCR